MPCNCSCAQRCAGQALPDENVCGAAPATEEIISTQSDKAAPRSMRSLRVNQAATIVSITAGGETARRMRDLGLRAGVPFCVVGRAPLVDPVAIAINGSVLTLRNSEADHILVETTEEQACKTSA